MSTENPPAEPVVDADTVTPPVGDAAPVAPAKAPVEVTAPEGVDQLPDWAQKELKRLRNEAAKERTTAKEKAAQEAREAAEAAAAAALQKATEEHQDRLKQIAKVLGLAPDEGEVETPERMVERVTAELATEREVRVQREKRFRELSIEVAVQDAANMHDARAERLLDSRSFMQSVQGLDPDGEGFRAAIADAVKAAVEGDPDLKVTRKPAPPSASGGTTVAGTPTKKVEDYTIEEFEKLLLAE